ncbi:hypothetical protein ACSBR1_027347 [Camellia fascicularis]
MTEHLLLCFLARCSGLYCPSVPHIFPNPISRKEHIPIRQIPQIFWCFHCKFASLLPASSAELKSSSCEDHRRCQTYARHGTMVFGSLGLVSLAPTLLPDSIVLGRVPVMLLSRLIIVHAFSNSRGNNLRRNILSV